MKNKVNVILSLTCCFLILIITFPNNVNAKKYNMAFLYGNGNYESMVKNTNDLLNEVSPSYFNIDSTGNLSLNNVSTEFISNMHDSGKKVVPFLSNHWDRASGRSALANKDKLVKDIALAIKRYNLDGVNVDIENLTEADRKNYIEFVKALKLELGENSVVSVSVAANPYGWTTGWHGSYDYEQLGKYADYLMIMAYDEHYEGGEAGAVAGYQFVQKSLEYAFKYVSKDKIILGIPLYGRYWVSRNFLWRICNFA